MTSSKGLGKILALGAGMIVSGIFAENAYSQSQNLKPGDTLPNSKEVYQGPRKDIIIEMLNEGKITLDEVVPDGNGVMTIKRKNKTGKGTAGTEKKVEPKKQSEETKKDEKRTEIERKDKKRLGIDIKEYLFSDTDANKSNTTGVGVGCDVDLVASKNLLGVIIGTYAKGKIDCNEAQSRYGSDSTSTLDSLTSKFNIPLLVKIKKGFFLGFGAQLENLIASIYSDRSDSTIAHTENYSGSTVNLLSVGKKINLDAYFGNISGNVEDKVNNISVKRDVNGSSYGLKLVYNINNKKKIIAEIEGGKKGDYDSTGLKIAYGKNNLKYGLGLNSVSGNNFNNSQMMLYLTQRFGRKQ